MFKQLCCSLFNKNIDIKKPVPEIQLWSMWLTWDGEFRFLHLWLSRYVVRASLPSLVPHAGSSNSLIVNVYCFVSVTVNSQNVCQDTQRCNSHTGPKVIYNCHSCTPTITYDILELLALHVKSCQRALKLRNKFHLVLRDYSFDTPTHYLSSEQFIHTAFR